MTKYAEVIYETGSHSVASYESEEDLKRGLKEQHRRALAGEVGGPTGHPAERVKKVLLYDEHPSDYNAGGTISLKDAQTLLEEKAQGGQVSVNEVNRLLNAQVSPLVAFQTDRHASMYVAPETGELDLSFLKGGEE